MNNIQPKSIIGYFGKIVYTQRKLFTFSGDKGSKFIKRLDKQLNVHYISQFKRHLMLLMK